MDNILFVLGPTNCGKTTVINKLTTDSSIFYPVLVGKKLRAMFPPEFFDGQAAPAKTDDLAFKLMCEGVDEALSLGKIPVIDGQPRNAVQYDLCSKFFGNHNDYFCCFVNLWASRDVRLARATFRDGNDSSKLKLSLDRMDSDVLILYDIISRLHAGGECIFTFDTGIDDYFVKIIESLRSISFIK